MPILTGIFSLMIAAAGWYYLFYSDAVHRLAAVEDVAINTRRVRIRRLGSVLLILLAMLFYVGSAVVSWDEPTVWFAVIWLGVMVLVGVVTILALLDLRLTNQLRQRRKRDGH